MNKRITTFSSIKEILKYIWEDKILLIFVLFIALISATAIITSSIFVGSTLNLLVEYTNDLSDNGKHISTNEMLNILYSSLITISLYLVNWISNTNILVWSVKISYKCGSKIRYKLFNKLLNVPISFIDKNKVGELMSKATSDVDIMIINLVQFTVSFFVSPFVIIASLIAIFIVSPILSLISIGIMLIIFLSTYLFAKWSSPNFIKLQDKLGQLNAINEECLVNKLPIYIFNHQKRSLRKFNKVNKQYEENSYKAEYKVGMIYPILDLLENIAYGIIYAIGFIFIIKHINHYGITELNVGTLATFVVLVRLANGEIGNIARFGSILEKLFACLKRILNLINEEDDIDNGTYEINDLNGDIEFKNVSFGYSKENLIIKNLSLHIKKGQKVAIVGHTGSGKSTLINLIMRFYDVNEGEILINNININKIKKDNLRKHISIVLQESSLFSESILTNISYGHHGPIDKEKIINSSKEIGSYHYISLLENGFDTEKNISSISSGEAQLLALTRAHYSPSNILILDEATSNIDSKTEQDVQRGMIKLMKNKTTLIIAHRLSTIVNSDLIVVLKEGKIIEQGTHKELIDNKGYYYNLYKNNSLESE